MDSDNNIQSFERLPANVFFKRTDYSDVEFEKRKNGGYTFKINRNGKSVYAHSKYNPEREAEKFVDGFEFQRDTIFVIFGFGLGYFAREIIKRCTNQNFLIIYEPDNALFSKIVDEGLCEDIFKNESVYLLSGGDEEVLDIFLRQIVDQNVYMRCKTVIIPAYKEAYYDKLIPFMETVRKMMELNSITRDTMWYNRETWVKNPYFNFENVLSSYCASQMDDIFKGKTAVIVAAGPSLKKNMHLLKEIKGKVPIISVFVAAKALLENGIVPDFIVSMDSAQEGMTEGFYDDIPLIYDSRVNKKFIDSHKGKHIFLVGSSGKFEEFIMSKYGKKYKRFLDGGSVACTCVSIAENMGCKNIILIGQDLAYTNNLCHVEGTVHKQKTPDEIDREKYEVPAVGGGTVLTDDVFMYYITWFENYAFNKKSVFTLIDATEGGALIKNTEVLSFREAIDKYCSDASVDKVLSEFFEKGTIFTDEEKIVIRNDFYSQFDEVESILKIVREEKELFDKYIKSVRFSSNIKGIIKIERQLDEYDKKIDMAKRKIEMLLCLADNITQANKLLEKVRKEYDDNPVVEAALTRKGWLLEFEATLESLKNLREETENG